MRSNIYAILCILALLPALASAAPLDQAVRALRGGDYENALALFQELQLQTPDSPEVLYGLGCVQYQRGLSRKESAEVEEAKLAFQEARAAFNGVVAGSGAHLHADAAFNLANVVAQEAALLAPEDTQGRIGKWREAIAAYERVLAINSAHEGAQRNLDHARYQLKLLLQQAQEEEQQEEQQQEEDPPPMMVYFQNAGTEIPNASAVADENTVQLVRPGSGNQGGAKK